MSSLDARLKNIFFEIFDLKKEISISEISADKIENWDSLNHLNLILSLEDEFKIDIPPDDFLKLHTDFESLINYLEENIK